MALAATTVSADELDQYREFRLGSSAAAVSGLTSASASDLRTLHQRPALLQVLAWRPRYGVRRPIPDVDPVREMRFSFYNDELYRIAVEYDQLRTAGLTNDDMVAALTAIYGQPDSPAASAGRPARLPYVDASTTTVLLAEWQRGDTRLSLHWSDYLRGFSLLMSSERLDAMARTATAQAIVMDTREAPAREAARVKAQADAERVAGEKARATNKDAFRP
jgi:hypothetical protein